MRSLPGAVKTMLALLALMGAHPASSQTGAPWRVESVTSSNSLVTVDSQGVRKQLILAYLSIPSGRQPYADRAAQVLRAQLVGQQVNVRPVGRQGQDYVSALVYVGSNNFNEDFLRRGHAWVNPMQDPPPQWRRIEAAARATRSGLWATANPVHPIDWETSQKQAVNVRGTLDRIANDEAAQKRMRSTFVGSRSAKVYYPFSCAPWLELGNRDVVVFTTARGAQASGFRAIPCKPRG